MTDVLGKSINNATRTHQTQSGGRVTSAFWRLNRMKRFVTVWLSIEVSFTAQTKNSRKDPRHRHWSRCITAVMFIQSDTCFGILLNLLNYFLLHFSRTTHIRLQKHYFCDELYAYFVYIQQFPQSCTVKLIHLCFSQHIYSIWEIFLVLISEELILFSLTEFKFLGPLKQLGPKNLFISQSQCTQWEWNTVVHPLRFVKMPSNAHPTWKKEARNTYCLL